MFEVVELHQRVNKQDYEKRAEKLRPELLEAQYQLKQSARPVLLLFSGVPGGGKGEVLNLLNEWMDPRFLDTRAYGPRSEEERERPVLWRYWRDLPPRGRIAIFIDAWYAQVLELPDPKNTKEKFLAPHLARIVQLEKQLVEDGAIIIKCWLHLSKKAQENRFKKLRRNKETRWRVTKEDLIYQEQYSQRRRIAERVIRETSTGEAPWLLVDGEDAHHRNLTTAEHILSRVKSAAAPVSSATKTRAKGRVRTQSGDSNLLASLDLSKKLEKERYTSELHTYQGTLSRLARKAWKRKLSSILVFEGWDAAGKGGAIRRLTHGLDARGFRVIPIAAPTDEEKAHHYLWRFWRHIPRAGQVTIYDRSWYGRVLVERVEGYASEAEWLRAYYEINDFEEQLQEYSAILLKFWVHISPEEQLRRFKEREQVAYKHFKITEDDYRNREKWPAYEAAVMDMVMRTSTEYAPWHLIEGEDQRYARVQVLKTYCQELEKILS
jgi:polyphosphate:AMP phosphotransferase